MLSININIQNEIRAIARKSVPYECCGFICVVDGEQILLPSPNLADDKINNFAIDPDLYIYVKQWNYEIVGFYHSHGKKNDQKREPHLSEQDKLAVEESCLFSCVYDMDNDTFVFYEPKFYSSIKFSRQTGELNRVYIEGNAGRIFGNFWELDTKTTRETIEAVDVNSGFLFGKYMQEKFADNLYYVLIYNNNIVSMENFRIIDNECKKENVHILPAITGKEPLTLGAMIIIGIVLAIISAGISYLLMPTPPKISTNSSTPIFNNGPSPTLQGTPVPMGYGELIIWPSTASVCFNYSHLFS